MTSTPKYHNTKLSTNEGVFDSKLEYRRYLFLRDQQRRGNIRNLMRQVKYTIIPKQYELVEFTRTTRSRGTSAHNKGFKQRVLFKECTYTADFVYDIPVSDPNLTEPVWLPVVEDTKSSATANSKDFKIKQKLMCYINHIVLHIVSSPADPVPVAPSVNNKIISHELS